MAEGALNGKVVAVTGANIGIGFETAVSVAGLGATTVLVCRNQDKARAAAAKVTARTGSTDVHCVSLDLADLASVQAAADDIHSRWDRLDVLVNNAGGIWSERQLTAEGFEQTFGVNHLGHFLLTRLLLQRMVDSAPARVVNVASTVHRSARTGVGFDDLQAEQRYRPMDAYARSKLANILFTRELAERVDPAAVTVNAAHPGPVRSGFGMDGDMKGLLGIGNKIFRLFEISPASGAKTSVHLAAAPEVAAETGKYWARSKVAQTSVQAQDDAAAARLWSVSEDLLADAGFATPALPG